MVKSIYICIFYFKFSFIYNYTFASNSSLISLFFFVFSLVNLIIMLLSLLLLAEDFMNDLALIFSALCVLLKDWINMCYIFSLSIFC